MNKTELIAKVSEDTGLSKKDAFAAVESVIAAITDAVAAGERVSLIGFGTFERKHREARIGRNPRTKEAVEIPASNTPSFKPGKEFKAKVNR